MTRHASTIDRRAEQALAAWAALPSGGHDHAVLHIQCGHGHHVAVVFATPVGEVFRAPVRSRGHGSRDRVDEPHGDHESTYFFDLLDTTADAGDDLPAWCDCGPRSLSRAAVSGWVAAHEKRIVID